jgi:hypothetical protein
LLAAGANGISEPRLHRGAAALRRGQCTECPHQLIAVWECRRDRQRRPPRHDMQRLLHQIQIAPATRPRASALRLASRWRASAGDGLRRYRKAGVQHSGGDHLCLLFRLDCGTRRQTFFCPGRVRVADPACKVRRYKPFSHAESADNIFPVRVGSGLPMQRCAARPHFTFTATAVSRGIEPHQASDAERLCSTERAILILRPVKAG